MHRDAAAGKPLSTLDEPSELRESNGCWILTNFWTDILTRRHWLLFALLPISFLAVGGAVFGFAGLSAEGGSILPLLVWGAIFFLALILLITQVAGVARNAGQEAGGEEIVEALPIGVALYDSSGNIRHCNEAFRQAFPDPGVRTDFASLATAIAGDPKQPAEFAGEHEMADGRWLLLGRRELANGGFVVTAQDISRFVTLEADYRAAGKQFRQFLSAAAEWIWETDVLHRFVMARTIATDAGNMDFGWMTGCSPAELTAAGEDAEKLAAKKCMLDMDQRHRLNDVCLTLDSGGGKARVRLSGLPRYDGNGEFLGYRGVGLWEPAAAPEETMARRVRPAPFEPIGPLLIVDDSSTNRILATTILDKMGYEADAVPDGREAIEAVRDGGYAAVLMDIWMPEMDGFEATAAIRNLPEPKGSIPVIAMTAHTGAEERQRCLAAGMNDHVEKPIDRALLATILRRLAGPPPNLTSPAKNGDEPAEGPDVQPAAGLVNDDVLGQLRTDAGPALVNELISAYMAETDERLVRIAAEIEDGDLDGIAAEAHSMKSSSGTFGALPLQALSARLEAAATQGDVAAVAAINDKLPVTISKTWREFGARGYRRD
jgi:CheY-like chemotaxis protein/HPt (histidine-containing phosphotransfer) domain-containing protein/PAS domain-containing protein